jgi:hypothetical protein
MRHIFWHQKRPDRVTRGRNMAEKPIFTKNLKGKIPNTVVFYEKFDFAENEFLRILWRAEHDFDGKKLFRGVCDLI